MTPEEQKRSFKGVWIDKKIWFDKRLNALEKIILVEIDSLDNEDGCFASNEYIAEFCQCSERKVRDAIAKLKEYGYIYVSGFDGRKRTIRSRVAENAGLSGKKRQAERQKLPHNNIVNNKDDTERKKEEEKEKPQTKYDEIINELVKEEPVKNALYEFIKMRKLIKEPLTDNALKLIIAKLEKLSGGDAEKKIELLNQSIINNWKGIFPIKKVWDSKKPWQKQDDDRFYKSEVEDDDLPF